MPHRFAVCTQAYYFSHHVIERSDLFCIGVGLCTDFFPNSFSGDRIPRNALMALTSSRLSLLLSLFLAIEVQ